MKRNCHNVYPCNIEGWKSSDFYICVMFLLLPSGVLSCYLRIIFSCYKFSISFTAYRIEKKRTSVDVWNFFTPKCTPDSRSIILWGRITSWKDGWRGRLHKFYPSHDLIQPGSSLVNSFYERQSWIIHFQIIDFVSPRKVFEIWLVWKKYMSLSLGGSFTPSQYLRPSSGREHTVISYSVRWWGLYSMNETRRKPTTWRQPPSLFNKWHGIFYMPSGTEKCMN